MIFLAFTRNDDVVHISEGIVSHLVFKDLLGEAGKSRAGALESLGHLYEAVRVEGGDEAGTSLVFLFHMNLVVTREAV